MTRRARRPAALALILLGLACPSAHARTLTLGFDAGDPPAGDPAAAGWLDDARALGAGVIRLTARWSAVAPSRPAQASDPDDPAYRWAPLDAAVRALAARGLAPIMTIMDAPSWAEGDGRPDSAEPGTWKPDPAALGDFARAAATRYSGAHPDPASPGATLPRVRLWQVWNEPNLSLYLTPQWTRDGGRWRASSPATFRRLLNAAYAAIKDVQPDAVVASGGTAPYGDPVRGGARMAPVPFMRALVCAPGAPPQTEGCDQPAHLDAFDHHPYGTGGPYRKALQADDVAVPDLAKLTVPVRGAARDGRLLPRGHKALWITEISWDSSPPDPQGVPAARHALWLAQSLSVLSRAGADLVAWLMVRDQPPDPSYAASYQAGVELADGSPKPAARAFRFPFVVDAGGRGVWGRAPADGVVRLQRLSRGRWTTFRRYPARAGAVFKHVVRLRTGSRVRATEGSEASLAWRVR